MSVSNTLQKTILLQTVGSVFCANDFIAMGSKGNIDVILHRLSKKGMIRQLGYGLYDIPRKSTLLGDLTPEIKDIINAYSRKIGQSFVLDPLNAANAMGMTTQVPTKLTFLTDGKSHTLTICGLDIHLIHASAKKIVGAMTPIGVIIQALRYFGPNGAPDSVMRKIASQISQDDLQRLIRLRNNAMRNLIPQIDRLTQIATIH